MHYRLLHLMDFSGKEDMAAPMYLTQRIGNTTYRVKVVANESGTQKLEDILLRLVRDEALANDGECGILSVPQRDRPQTERMIS